jgi:HEAT repeat protein
VPESLLGEGALRVVIGAALAAVALCLFLTATAVALRIRNSIVARRWERLEERWTPVVLDALESDGETSYLRSLPSSDTGYFLRFLTRFARRLRGPELERMIALAGPLAPVTFRQLASRSAETRAQAVDLLGLLSPAKAGPALAAALDDRSILVAMVAARALSRDRHPDHAEALVGHLHRFQHWRPTFLAAMLSQLGDDVAPGLRHVLADAAQPPRVRVVAAEALGRLNDLAAAEAAVAVAEREPDPEVRAAALRLLARVGVPDHLPVIRRSVEAPEEIVRIAATRALAELASPDDVELLSRAFFDPSLWVAEPAARGLARGAGRDALVAIAGAAGPRATLAREALVEALP